MTTDWDDSVEAKYITFKREDWNAWAETTDELRRWMAQAELSDAVIIRLKDPFAVVALYTYAETILNHLEMNPDLDPEVHQRMIEIADYFHGQGDAARAIKGKRLPD